MIRDTRLQGLSAEHHHALVLARKLLRHTKDDTVDAALVLELKQQFERDLLPHFAVEEEALLPALMDLGEDALVQRTNADHATLRHLARAAQADFAQVAVFAELLEKHIRFEERELFPRCEQRLATSILDEVERRAPANRQ